MSPMKLKRLWLKSLQKIWLVLGICSFTFSPFIKIFLNVEFFLFEHFIFYVGVAS